MDQALKYTDDTSWATAMEPMITPHKVGAAPKLVAYLSAVGTMMYVFTCKDNLKSLNKQEMRNT